jgi:RimJ/RimL family protein N-acetyltransferase
MTEAASALIEHLFADPATQAIHSGVLAGNDASLRVQTKLGFAETSRDTLFSRPLARGLPHIRTMLTRDGFKRFARGQVDKDT